MLMTFLFQQVFSARGALIHIGAMMATIMSANVLMIIIPGQKRVIAALTAGATPDPALGKRAKIRSTHNNYLTLPVLLLMLSTHYAMQSNTPHLWALVGLILIAGALVRHLYNVRHAGRGDLWWTWGAAAACMIAPCPQRHGAPSAVSQVWPDSGRQSLAGGCAARRSRSCRRPLPSPARRWAAAGVPAHQKPSREQRCDIA
jgi:uncharacterized membrane protein